MIKTTILTFFFVLPLFVFGQKVVSGRIVDTQLKAIDNVSLSYKKVGSATILGFTKSQQDGSFRLEVKIGEDVDSLELDLNHLSYARKSIIIANKTGNYTYVLHAETRQLKVVNVGNIPIFRKKDTVNYNVDAFTSKQDRVIADIIRKLPGIEMRGNQILYQGKPIQKYTVNNLDLMEGRYGMINDNMPADAVKKVQVIENDQPIKILDSLVFSDRASLNLELKKFTTTGTAKLGVGLSPVLWDLNLTPMTFGKTFQMLNSFQTNNTGDDASKNLNSFYTEGPFFQQNENTSGTSFLSIQEVSSPGFEEKKWLDNQLFLFSTNILQKLKNGLEVKGNISYYNDYRKRAGYTLTEAFAPDQSIFLSESVDNKYRINDIAGGLLIEKNEKNIYFRNSLKFHKRWNSDYGSLLFNEENTIDQKRHYDDQSLLNNFSLARFVGKQLVNINSTIEWIQTPQFLSVNPGPLEDILNNGDPYDQLQQQIDYGIFHTKNSLSFVRGVKNFTFSPQFAINYQANNLASTIHTFDKGKEDILGAGYVNALQFQELGTEIGTGIQYEKNKLKLLFNLPFAFSLFNATQQDVKTLDKVNKHTFNPSGSLRYKLNMLNEISINANRTIRYSGSDNFYNAYIVNTYRNIQRYQTRLLGNESLSTGIRYDYKNMLKANFANASYQYVRGKRDYIFRSQLDSVGRTMTSIEDRESDNFNHTLAMGLSRFFSSAKTVVKLNANFSYGESDYLLNAVMGKQKFSAYGGNLEIINNKWDVIGFEYKTNLTHSENKYVNGAGNRILSNNHFLNVMVYPGDHHVLTIKNAYYHTNIAGLKSQYFLDLIYRYRVERWKADIEISGQNLLDNKRYTQQFSNDYQLVETYFDLRPRQVLISTKFNF